MHRVQISVVFTYYIIGKSKISICFFFIIKFLHTIFVIDIPKVITLCSPA